MKNLDNKDILTIGLMLFALFFGAGNLIFPPSLGQAAGTHVIPAMMGFLITGVGLPLLAVTAVGLAGGNLQTLAIRVHPAFGTLFPVVIYLAIGPFFGIPRTGTVAFEMGVSPFLPEAVMSDHLPLFLYTLVYFGITYWLCLNPSKLVDRIGKILTPILLIIITVLFVQSLIHPMGELDRPTKDYEANPFFKGFLNGYLTMDTLGALAFGIIISTAIQERKVTEPKKQALATIKAGIIAALVLGLVYFTLGYLGATSQNLAMSDNGGEILTSVTQHLFGKPGSLLLGLAVTLACLTTSVGLTTACAQFFAKMFPKMPYNMLVSFLVLFSMSVANLGLTKLISISVPVLIGIYPLAIVLILLSFFHNYFKGLCQVYVCALIGTALISMVDGLKSAQIKMGFLTELYSHLPFYNEGIGWIMPAILGAVIGYVWGSLKQNHFISYKDSKAS